MAIMLPLVMLCLFLTAHLCLLYLARQAALSTAQIAVEGERGWGAEPGAGELRAQRFLERVPAVLTDAEIEVAVSEDGTQVTATVAGTATSIIPWFNQSVTQSASGPVERVTEVP